MFLGRYPKNSVGVIDEGRMKKETSDLFRKLGITVDLTQPMKKMSVSQRQMCEIAKAISYHSKVIVLDEPTSSLTAPEVEKLFKMMRQLKAQGIALIYISHKMDEIFEICDEISVLRDGSLVMTKPSKETDMNELIAAMVGRSLDNRFPPVDNTPGETILSVQNISTKYAPKLQNISFDIKKGEIFGFYGLVGILVTKASKNADFSNILVKQLFGIPKALYLVGGSLIFLGAVTPLNVVLFAALGAAFIVAGRMVDKNIGIENIEEEVSQAETEAEEMVWPILVTPQDIPHRSHFHLRRRLQEAAL